MTDILLSKPVRSDRAMLVFDNVALARRGATAAGAAVVATLGPQRLIDGNSGTYWRSDPFASEEEKTFTIQFPPSDVSWVSLHFSNVQVPWGVEFFAEGSSAPTVWTGWYDPVIRYALGDVPWETMEWGLGPNPARLAKLTAEARLSHFVELESKVHGCVSVRVRFDIGTAKRTTQERLNYLKVGKIIVGNVWRPEFNILRAWTMGTKDLTNISVSDRGTKFFLERPVLANKGFSLGWLNRRVGDEMRRFFEDWFLKFGRSHFLFAWLEPANQADFYSEAGIYYLVETPNLSMDQLLHASARNFALEEAI